VRLILVFDWKMDPKDFRSILESAGIDIWMLMDVAIAVASADHSDELKRRRDGIVERLYATSLLSSSRCPNCDIDDVREIEMQSNPSAEEEKDTCEVLLDDEQKKILEIKEQLEDPHQVFLLSFLNLPVFLSLIVSLIANLYFFRSPKIRCWSCCRI